MSNSYEEKVEMTTDYVIEQTEKRMRSPEIVRRELISKGWSEDEATMLMTNAKKKIAKGKSSQGIMGMLIGALFCAVGIFVSASSYGAASEGGTYFVLWGLIVFGAILFFVGLAQRFRR